MTFDELKEKAHALPLKPGVYIMQDVHSTVAAVPFFFSNAWTAQKRRSVAAL